MVVWYGTIHKGATRICMCELAVSSICVGGSVARLCIHCVQYTYIDTIPIHAYIHDRYVCDCMAL